MQVHRIQNNNQTTFGSIIENDNRYFTKGFCDNIENIVNQNSFGKNFKSGFLAEKKLIKEVIKHDFNTPELKNIYNKLLKSHEINPIDVKLGLFIPDKNELPLYLDGWYLKATVGNITFKQATTAYFINAQTPIKFLKKACIYANILKYLRFLRLDKLRLGK